jgi:hypothetical protein
MALFDHNLVDDAPAAGYMKQFIETIKSEILLNIEPDPSPNLQNQEKYVQTRLCILMN